MSKFQKKAKGQMQHSSSVQVAPSPEQSEGEKAQQSESKTVDGKNIWTLELKKIGIVVQILRTPMAADIDRSGGISGKEALILGLALSLDAFGAGIGAALLGYSPWLTAVTIGTMSSVFVFGGMKVGSMFADTKWMSRLRFLPGIVLIVLGFMNMI
jgi:putative sporulation protein YtaF